jgi:rRNA maturation RNase YbeY
MADIYISVERVQENSQNFGVLFEIELNRVMLHGLLHVLGYKDAEKNDKTLMSSKEDYYLALYDNI